MVQRGFMRRGVDELQNRFLGSKDRADEKQIPPDGGTQRRNSTEELIRRGLEGFFRR
jgi:hypothetical protein